MSEGRRARTIAIVLVLTAGALLLITSTQTWVEVTLRDNRDATLAVAGATAVPVLAPLALAAVAVGAALSLAGRVMGTLFGVVAAGLGCALILVAVPLSAWASVGAVASTVTEATGIAGDDAVARLIDEVTPTPWPVIAVSAAVTLAGAGLFIAATAHRWTATGRRYRTGGTGSAPVRAGDARPDPSPRGSESGTLDAIDSWDDLSHGGDPTAHGRGVDDGNARGPRPID